VVSILSFYYAGKDSNSDEVNIVESGQPQVIKLYGWKGYMGGGTMYLVVVWCLQKIRTIFKTFLAQKKDNN
jgi:hypothetical protein